MERLRLIWSKRRNRLAPKKAAKLVRVFGTKRMLRKRLRDEGRTHLSMGSDADSSDEEDVVKEEEEARPAKAARLAYEASDEKPANG